MSSPRSNEREEARVARFERTCAGLLDSGHVRRDLTIDLATTGTAGSAAMLVPMAFVLVAFLAFAPVQSFYPQVSSVLVVLAFGLALVAAHELIHGLVWGILAPGHFSSIEFGVIWEWLTAYCVCTTPLRPWQYVLGAAMPTLVLGGGLAALAIQGGSWWTLFLAEFMIFAGGGDAAIIATLVRAKPRPDALCLDHPTDPGLVLFERS